MTHILGVKCEAEGDVGEAGKAAPHDNVAGGRVVGAVKISIPICVRFIPQTGEGPKLVPDPTGRFPYAV